MSNLRHERKRRGWSQAYVAAKIGSDPKTVSRWETGAGLPGPFLLRRLVELFAMDAEELGLLPGQEQIEASTDSLHRHEDWGEAPPIESFYGRKQEMATLEGWILADHCRVVIVQGFGGVGKTTLATALAKRIAGEFQYIFWRSLQYAPSAKDILEKYILFLAGRQQIDLPTDIDGLLSLLMTYLHKERSLLILDNFESALQSGDQTGQYQSGYEGLGKLIQRLGEIEHKSCLVITSREKPRQISRLEGRSLPVRSLQLNGIEQAEGQMLLENTTLFGSSEAWANLVQLYAGNPLALKLIADPIQEVFGGSIANFLKDEQAVFGDVYDLLDQQFHRLSELEQNIMYWLAIEREPVSLQEIQSNITHHIAKGALIEAVHSLRRRSMIERNAHNLFTLQPVIMEYVTRQIVEQADQEVETGTISILSSHALVKAQAKDYVRHSQVRFILAPIAERLLAVHGATGSQEKLKRLLAMLRHIHTQQDGYTAGNILNLLIHLYTDLRSYDFSHLTIRQAYLQGVALPEINFKGAHFATSVFTDTFGSILCVAFSPTGKLLAAGTVDGEIRLWQANNGAPLLTCYGHTGGVRFLAFGVDDEILISGSNDHTVRLWNVHTGHCFNILQGHDAPIRCVACSPDGIIIASGSEDQTIRLWNSATGQCLNILRGHSHWVRSISFSSDGSMLASGGNDRTIRIWNSSTGGCLSIIQGHTNIIRSVAFRPGSGLLVSSGDDETVRLWNTSTNQCLKVLRGHVYPIRSVTFSPGGELIASGGDDRAIRIWNADTGRCTAILQGHSNRVWSVSFRPDGQVLASGGEDQAVRFWNINTGYCLRTLQGYSSLVWSIAFSPGKPFVAVGSDDHCVRVWDINSSRCLNILPGHKNRVRAVSFSPDGRLLASGSEDQTIRLWDVGLTSCLKTLRGHSHLVKSIAFSPDGRLLVSGSYDQTIRVWDISTGRCLKILQDRDGLIWSVNFSPDSRFIVSSKDDHIVQIWDSAAGYCQRILQEHLSQVRCVTSNSASNILASAHNDQSIKLWDMSTGHYLRTLQGPAHWARLLACSLDGRVLACVGEDQTITLWDIHEGCCFKTLQSQSSLIWSVAFSSDGRIVGAGSADGTVELWDTQTGVGLETLRSERPYEGMNISGVKGLTESQKVALKMLGAIEDQR